MNKRYTKSTLNNNKKYSVVLITAFIAVSVLILFVCALYLRQLKVIIKNETISYLREICNHEANIVDLRIDSQIETLSILSDSIAMGGLRPEDGNTMMLLRQEAHKYNYLLMGIISKNGLLFTTTGVSFNVSETEEFKKFMTDKTPKADIFSANDLGDDENVFMYMVPIISNDEVTGLLIAVKDIDEITSALSIESFGGEGYSQLVNKNGKFVVKSGSKNAYKESDNFFEMLKSQSVIYNGKTIDDVIYDFNNANNEFIEYKTDDGIHKFVQYKKLNTNDWYILTVVPAATVNAKTSMLIRNTAIINILFVTLFISMALVLRMVQTKNKREMEHLAFVDPVTGGISNTLFEYSAKKLIEKSKPNTFIFTSLDIGKFKLINDAYGTEGGNKILKQVYDKISSVLDKDELVARVSADNFNMLLKSDTNNLIKKRLDSITESINSDNSILFDKYYLNFFCGICRVTDINNDIINIRDHANTARKEIKSATNSNDKYSFYSEDMKDRMVKEKELENTMQSSLENNEFIVYLQPKIELVNNSIAGAEALVRWNHPKFGFLPPSEFISLFEKNGFIVKLDLFVFESVCKKIKQWIDNEIKPIVISVNLSKAHLENTHFLEEFIAIKDKYNIPPECIEIELTETLVFENMERLISVVNDIHNLGFTCSLDDFGSGYSSLNMLKDVPVDVLKLDRMFFINNSDEKTERGDKVVESVIELAKKLHMKTVSEGIEHMTQVDFLREVNCDMIQGYIFSKPLPMEDFENMMIKSMKKNKAVALEPV